jgi:hypothetical protein
MQLLDRSRAVRFAYPHFANPRWLTTPLAETNRLKAGRRIVDRATLWGSCRGDSTTNVSFDLSFHPRSSSEVSASKSTSPALSSASKCMNSVLSMRINAFPKSTCFHVSKSISRFRRPQPIRGQRSGKVAYLHKSRPLAVREWRALDRAAVIPFRPFLAPFLSGIGADSACMEETGVAATRLDEVCSSNCGVAGALRVVFRHGASLDVACWGASVRGDAGNCPRASRT